MSPELFCWFSRLMLEIFWGNCNTLFKIVGMQQFLAYFSSCTKLLVQLKALVYRRHYLSYTKISQTKCYKQSDTIFQFSFHCSFRCCAPFCLLCCPLGPLLLIGGKLSTANQDPPKEWFKSATQRAKRSTPSERAMKTELKSDVRLFVAFCLTYFIVWHVVHTVWRKVLKCNTESKTEYTIWKSNEN